MKDRSNGSRSKKIVYILNEVKVKKLCEMKNFLLWVKEFYERIVKVFIFTRYVFIHFVCTFYIEILGNKIDLELPSGLAWRKFVKSHLADFDTELALDLMINFPRF